eukprot:g3422.t1
MHSTNASILTVFVVCFCILATTQASSEPSGRLKLLSVSVNDLPGDSQDSLLIYMKCSTLSQSSRVPLKIRAGPGRKKLVFPSGEDLKISLLSHESVECELLTGLDDETSHGLCELTYARFLAPENNVVSCSLSDGSSFTLQLRCNDACPEPVSPPTEPYCKEFKTLQAVDVGNQRSFSDGSPGFALYAPNSTCVWTIPRVKNGATNFLFTRFDLGSGDFIEAYSSSDGIQETFIKNYTTNSAPESVSTVEKYLILKFSSDSKDEGLGFAGFYYYTAELAESVGIVPGKNDFSTNNISQDSSKQRTGSRKDL